MENLFSQQIILLFVISFAIVFFVMEILPLEVTALAAVGLLLLFNVITTEQALSGFSNNAVITIGAIFILSRSLVKTGFLEVLAQFLYKLGGNNVWVIVSIFLITVSLVSGFINNTAAVAIFIPVIFKICQKYHISPTKLLLPLSYAAILGGKLTLIGTSTNLVVSSVVENNYEHFIDCVEYKDELGDLSKICADDFGWNPDMGNNIYDYGDKYLDVNNNQVWDELDPISMFEFTKIGLIFMLIGIIYIIIVSKWFLPSRAITSSLTQKYHMQKYLTEFKIPSDSKLIGKSFNYLNIYKEYGFQPYKIIREDEELIYNLN